MILSDLKKVMFLHLFLKVFLFYGWLCFCWNRSWFYFFCFARSGKRRDLREKKKKKREKLSASVFSVLERRRDFRSNLGFRGRWEKKKEGKRQKIPSFSFLFHIFSFSLWDKWKKDQERKVSYQKKLIPFLQKEKDSYHVLVSWAQILLLSVSRWSQWGPLSEISAIQEWSLLVRFGLDFDGINWSDVSSIDRSIWRWNQFQLKWNIVWSHSKGIILTPKIVTKFSLTVRSRESGLWFVSGKYLLLGGETSGAQGPWACLSQSCFAFN